MTLTGNGSGHQVNVGQDGHFTVTLAPGQYTAVGRSPSYIVNDVPGTCLASHGVQVSAGSSTALDVLCQMK